ncbi:hypothetical protein [Undibacterium sp. RuRC25W]|uniref:hypothetical protein n=1 Tax=Undibacterium sp. RuRC25W TaxID=3413047 RepID=UPI003BF2E25B
MLNNLTNNKLLFLVKGIRFYIPTNGLMMQRRLSTNLVRVMWSSCLVFSKNARNARKALLPWYARIFVPTVTGIRARNDTKNFSVELVDTDQSRGIVPFQEKTKNPSKGKPFCADMGQDITLSDRTLVKVPEGTVLDFISSKF